MDTIFEENITDFARIKRPLSGVALEFIRPGNPTDNGYIESFNGKFRDECLNQFWFVNLLESRATWPGGRGIGVAGNRKNFRIRWASPKGNG